VSCIPDCPPLKIKSHNCDSATLRHTDQLPHIDLLEEVQNKCHEEEEGIRKIIIRRRTWDWCDHNQMNNLTKPHTKGT
jgi:hypothetical protein